MKQWQKWWLRSIVVFALLHTIRDVLQELHVNSFFTQSLSSTSPQTTPLWNFLLGLVSEVMSGIAAIIALYTKSFKPWGYITFVSLSLFLFALVSYYFFL